MEEITIQRVGEPHLAFTGEMIGQSGALSQKPGGAVPHVRIFRTKGGQFVGAVLSDSVRCTTHHANKPEDIVAWLKKVSRENILSPEAQRAIEESSMKDEAFKTAWTEHID